MTVGGPPAAPEGLRDAKIMIVDDDPMARAVVDAMLRAAGYAHRRAFPDGGAAIDALDGWTPDLILLDIRMPEIDGFEMLRRLRARDDTAALPILIQTASTETDDRDQAFTLGATDVVSKPHSAIELTARVRTHLENRRLIAALSEQSARLEDDLRLAQEMQRALLPPRERLAALSDLYGVAIDHHFAPSDVIGGDLWGLYPIDGHRFALYAVDFSGHGLSAALNTFRIHTLFDTLDLTSGDPGLLMRQLNEALSRVLPPGQYATIFVGVFDMAEDSLRYAAAGCPEPFIGREGDLRYERCAVRGAPLGFGPGKHYEVKTLAFPPGAYFFAYSDALAEEEDRLGAMLDDQGVEDILQAALAAHQIEKRRRPLALILNRFFEHAAAPLADDLTAIWLSRPEQA